MKNLLFLSMLLFFFLTGCGGGGGVVTPPPGGNGSVTKAQLAETISSSTLETISATKSLVITAYGKDLMTNEMKQGVDSLLLDLEKMSSSLEGKINS
ncbi:MAG: hypothetical protein KJ613_04870, partial [Nanoarchaeota archaeon]|nr:hypothetical protein [Nanoarchaeota archaeon]